MLTSQMKTLSQPNSALQVAGILMGLQGVYGNFREDITSPGTLLDELQRTMEMLDYWLPLMAKDNQPAFSESDVRRRIGAAITEWEKNKRPSETSEFVEQAKQLLEKE
jgi:hypothetical protein